MNLQPGDLINAGVNVVTVYLLLRVMSRLDEVTDRIFKYLEEAKAQREAIMTAQGVKSEDTLP